MRQNVEAVFEGGLLRPLQALNLREGGHVRILVEEVETTQAVVSAAGNYNFADLRGTLKWQGDALTEQRRIRDEW